MKAKGELKLVFPTEGYKEQIEEYLREHFEHGEYELAGDGSLDKIKNFDEFKEIKQKKYIRINNTNLSAEAIAKMIKDEIKL